MDADIDRLLRESAPTVLLDHDVSSRVREMASDVTRQRAPRSTPARRVLISTLSLTSVAAAAAVAVAAFGHPGPTAPPTAPLTAPLTASGASYADRLAVVAAQAPAGLSLPAGRTMSDAAVAVLHKITVDPGYESEPGLRTVADVYRRYARCQAWTFKPPMGSFVNGKLVTPEDPTPAGPATLVLEPGVHAAPPRGPWVRIDCTDGLADPPSTDK
jgi:hypothetical protein